MAAIQHYVPRFLLRNFCTGKKRKLWAYDKSTAKSFKTNIQNVAGERDFYEAEIGDRILSLEEGLGAMESKTAAIIDRILAQRSIGDLSDDDRIQIAVFVAIQMRRVPNQREHLMAMNAGIRRALGDRDIDPELVDGLADITPNEVKAMSLMMLAEPNELPVHILDKTWLLFETDAATPFYISDNPVAMQNLVEPKGRFRGNLGLAVPGIEIYLPISSTMTLGFFCRSHEADIRNGVERMRARIVRDPDFPMQGFGPLLDWMRSFRKGTPLPSEAENVLNHNSLQVRQAERYVFSSCPDFSLVEDMIANEPRYRVGPRPHII
ncbi:MAG: DUF4238 domain-containing protein [Spirochaetes bacterium]|nr:DUF4238 domain-containing protein [Spirochaetota bacterium]